MRTTETIAYLLVTILTIVTKVKWKETKTLGRALYFLGIALALIVAINAFRNSRQEDLKERIAAKFGDIYDLVGAKIPKLQLGYSGVNFVSPSSIFSFDANTGPLLKLYVRDEKLFVTARIKSKDENPVAALVDNEWYIIDERYDYNNDETGFEVVVKGEDKVLFQVELKDGIAHFSGIIIDETGQGVYVYEEPGKPGATMQMITSKEEYKLQSGVIKPLFRYPRGKHLGKRLK